MSFTIQVKDQLFKLRENSPEHFSVRVSFSDNMIWNLIAQFERTGSVRDLTGKVLKRSVRINAAVEAAGQLALMWKKMLWKEPEFVSRKIVVI